MNDSPIPLIIDTDPGCDDAVALFLLANRTDISIKAITTVAGNGTLKDVTQNVKYLCELISLDSTLIAAGESTPLSRDLTMAVVHGENALAGIDTTAFSAETADSAVDKINELANQYSGELQILAIGPLTNIARALQMNPELEQNIKRIVIMGGALRVPGNKGLYAEFNFFVDPEAAQIVMQSKIEKVLIPLDLCNQVVLTKEEIHSLGNGKMAEVTKKLLLPYAKSLLQEDNINGAVMYDPLAAYYLINPEAFSVNPVNLTINCTDKPGAVMLERSDVAHTGHITVATEVNSALFKNALSQVIS